jgi:methyl-accepting chemotaxis protein
MLLTNESRELLGKIMAQLLSILALSAKAMTDTKISEQVRSPCFLLTDCVPEKILKKLMGRKDIEDALSRLDMLTKEETLMAMMRNLEATHQIDGAVCDVDSNVKATKVLTEDINDNVKATKLITDDIDGNVKASMVLTEDINDNVNATRAHIHDVDNNIKATKVLVEDIDENVKEIEGVARGVDNSTQRFLSDFIHVPIFCPIVSQHSHARA